MKLYTCNSRAVPGLNLAFLDADLKLGSVVHSNAFHNLGSGSKSATHAHPSQGRKCVSKFIFRFFLIRMINLGKMFYTKVVSVAIPFKMMYRTSV